MSLSLALVSVVMFFAMSASLWEHTCTHLVIVIKPNNKHLFAFIFRSCAIIAISKITYIPSISAVPHATHIYE